MASTGYAQFWWMTPIQFVAALAAGFNSGMLSDCAIKITYSLCQVLLDYKPH